MARWEGGRTQEYVGLFCFYLGLVSLRGFTLGGMFQRQFSNYCITVACFPFFLYEGNEINITNIKFSQIINLLSLFLKFRDPSQRFAFKLLVFYAPSFKLKGVVEQGTRQSRVVWYCILWMVEYIYDSNTCVMGPAEAPVALPFTKILNCFVCFY